ncbi:MAG TPA: hypothetical protein ENK27_08105 [Desulfobulbus sp.]|nr:hypothetical protein [Desulfobulbus sp.]
MVIPPGIYGDFLFSGLFPAVPSLLPVACHIEKPNDFKGSRPALTGIRARMTRLFCHVGRREERHGCKTDGFSCTLQPASGKIACRWRQQRVRVNSKMKTEAG